MGYLIGLAAGLVMLWLGVLPWLIKADARAIARQYGLGVRDDRTYWELLRFAQWHGATWRAGA